MHETIYASFVDTEEAQKAIGALLDHGVKAEHLTIIGPNRPWATPTGEYREGVEIEREAKQGLTTTTGEDAAEGAVKGAAWGLGLGVIGGLAALFIPGVGIVLGGGALAAALAGTGIATAGGAIAGAVEGYLVDQGVDPKLAVMYETAVDQGFVVVAVDVPYDKMSEDDVKDILAKYGATNLNAYDKRELPIHSQDAYVG